MELSLYYSQFLPAYFSVYTSTNRLVSYKDGPSDQEILSALSQKILYANFGLALRFITDLSTTMTYTAFHPVHVANNIEIASSAAAESAVQSFLASQAVVPKSTNAELKTQMKNWYLDISDRATNILKSAILTATNTAAIALTYDSAIKLAMKSFAKLVANQYVSVTIPVENESQKVELEWNSFSTAISNVTNYLRNKSVIASDNDFTFNFSSVESEYSTLFRNALASNSNSALNVYLLKNKITNMYLVFAFSTFLYSYGNTDAHALPINPEYLSLDVFGDETYGWQYELKFRGSSAELLENYEGPSLGDNARMGWVFFYRLTNPSYSITTSFSLPCSKNTQLGSFLQPFGLVSPWGTTEDNSWVQGSSLTKTLATIGSEISRANNSSFFGSMTEEEIEDLSNYELLPYVINNVIDASENYEFPLSIDPSIQRALIDDTFDVIGSGDAAGSLTDVIYPTSVEQLTETFPLADVIPEAINVYPVDVVEEKTITDNPADSKTIEDALEDIDANNQDAGINEGITPTLLTSATGDYGLFTLYKVTPLQLKALSTKLWSTDFIDNFHPFKNNPSEALISLMAYPMDIDSSGSDSSIICGNYNCSPASGKKISNLFNTKTLGSVQIPEKFNNFLDYSPYTKVHLFLPFIGFVDLDTDEVMGSTISVFYRVEVITGTCVACVKVIKGTMDAILYQFAGNMGITLPMSGSDFSRTYSLLATAGAEVLGGLVTGDGVSVARSAGIAGQAIANKPPVHKTGGLGGNSGMCGNLSAYVIIDTVVPDTPDGYGSLKGKPVNKYLRVGELNGFVQLDSFYLNTPNMTDEEKIELNNILKEGFFI